MAEAGLARRDSSEKRGIGMTFLGLQSIPDDGKTLQTTKDWDGDLIEIRKMIGLLLLRIERLETPKWRRIYMKIKSILGVVLCLLVSVSAMAATVNLAWDPNPATDQVLRYSVYQALALAGPFTKVSDVALSACTATVCTYSVTGLTAGIYYFRVTATNAWMESGPSNVVNTPGGGPMVPKNLIIVATVAPDGSITFRMITPEEFFRTVEAGG